MRGNKEEKQSAASGQRQAESAYAELFVKTADRMERLLRGAIWTGLALLVASQLLLSIPSVRKWAVRVERLEGIPIERSGPGNGP